MAYFMVGGWLLKEFSVVIPGEEVVMTRYRKRRIFYNKVYTKNYPK